MRKVDKAIIIPVKYINEIDNSWTKLQKKKYLMLFFRKND